MSELHLGVVLPNYGPGASIPAIRSIAEAAEELGFDSVWATEHVIVGPGAAAGYGTVYEPFATLSWIAGWTERIALGTSIVVLPLHNPILVAKQVATAQLLSGRPFTVGVGAGWHEDEFRFMGVDFASRGRRTDEALRLLRALWSGQTTFEGDFWQFRDATFGPLPELEPEVWIGGVKPASVRRALALGDAWHPSSNVDPSFLRSVIAEHPELKVIPRTTPDRVDSLLELGARGAAVMFDGIGAMKAFAAAYR
jgi:probable F420-dependent oxidoreductase